MNKTENSKNLVKKMFLSISIMSFFVAAGIENVNAMENMNPENNTGKSIFAQVSKREQINSEELDLCFQGKKPFYVMTVTRNASSVMLSSERLCIENIIKILCGSEDDITTLKNLLDSDKIHVASAKKKLEETIDLNGIHPYILALTNKKITDIENSYYYTKEVLLNSKWRFAAFGTADGAVVFNEMFFGKDSVYPEQEYISISKEFLDISYMIPNKLFFINVLGEIYCSIKADYSSFVNTLKPSNFCRNDFTFDNKTVKTDYISTAYTVKENAYAFENATTVFYGGKRICQYRKSTYFGEQDGLLDKKIPYMFGNGDVQYFCDLSFEAMLRKYLSFQICRDLLCDVGSCSQTGRLHIFQSNSLGFRTEKFSREIKTVVHADPEFSKTDGDFYCRRSVFDVDNEDDYPIRWESGGIPVFSFRFSLNDATYYIVIRDITLEFKKCESL